MQESYDVSADIDWKEKYFQLEMKMAQFHGQGLEIRKKLAIRIANLTVECEAATKRAEVAEEELKILKQNMKICMQEKDDRICYLEKSLQEQMDLVAESKEQSKLDAKLREEEREAVHEKTLTLKKWISSKLQEVENQKKLLFEANERATTSLYEMKRRVQELSIELNIMRHTGYSTRSHNLSGSQDNVPNDSFFSSGTTHTSNAQEMDVPSFTSALGDNAENKSTFDPGRADDDKSWSASCSPRSVQAYQQNSSFCDSSSMNTVKTVSHTSLIDSERKKETTDPQHFADPVRIIKKDDTSSEMETVKIPTTVHHKNGVTQTSPIFSPGNKKKKKSATLPKARAHNKKEPSTQHHSSLIETFGSFTRKFRGLGDSQHSSGRGVRRTQSAGKKDGKSRSGSSSLKVSPKHIASASVINGDPVKSQPESLESGLGASEEMTTSLLSQSLQEEEETASNALEMMDVLESNTASNTSCFSSSMPLPMLSSMLPRRKISRRLVNRSASMKSPTSIQPPTPPEHQTPLWETRILNLAQNGFQISLSDLSKSHVIQDPVTVHYHSCKEMTNFIYKKVEVDIPVYAVISGKLILLRQTAFTDASDSSEDDEGGRLPTQYSRLHEKNITEFTAMQPYAPPIRQRKNGSPGLTRAVKRANSTHSMTSSEGDYSIPPDAISVCSDDSEPEHKLFKAGRTGAPAATSSRVNSSGSGTSPENGSSPLIPPSVIRQSTPIQEKRGYLLKLSGQSRTWQRKWFAIQPGKMQYYNMPPDETEKKPLGEIPLDGETEIGLCSPDNTHTVIRISFGKRTIYLSAESSYVADDWLRALLIVLNRPHGPSLRKARRYQNLAQDKVSLKGWLERSARDCNRMKLWACIGNSSLYFFKEQDEKQFVGRLGLRDCQVTPVKSEHGNTICIKLPASGGHQKADVYLNLATEKEKEAWLYRLTVASGSLTLPSGSSEPSVGTPYERLVARILYVALCSTDTMEESIPIAACSHLWRNPVLSFSDEISEPLTTLSSDALHTEAIKLLKTCQQFMNVKLDAVSVDYHVTLAQRAASSCLMHPQLQEEVYAQLIRHSNRKIIQRNVTPNISTGSGKVGNPMRTDDETAVLQIWKLLALLIPLFLPHQRMLWFLKTHFHRHADDKSEIGQYVIYCTRALARAVSCGSRTHPPSRTETISILLQNPYQHSLPFSLPVHFLNGKYEVVSFDASTCADEFVHRICTQAKLREPSVTGFALFTDDPVANSAVEHLVPSSAKICDVISEWERTYRENSMGKFVDTTRMVKMSFTQHLSLSANRIGETEKEKFLLVCQTSLEISSDHLPVSREVGLELSSLCAQVVEGDIRPGDHDLKLILEKYYPARFLQNSSKQQLKCTREKLSEKWTSLRSKPSECARVYLAAVRKCPIYGAKLFKVKVETNSKRRGATIWLAVHEHGIYELNYSSLEVQRHYSYVDIACYGGCGERLMIVIKRLDGCPNKLFYSFPMWKATELIALVTEYIRIFLKNQKC